MKETKNNGATENKNEVVDKKSFWNRNGQKITRVLEMAGSAFIGFLAGRISSDLKYTSVAGNSVSTEKVDAPFEVGTDISE